MKVLTKLLTIRIVINIADSLFYMASIWMLSGGKEGTIYTAIAVTLFTLPDLLIFLIGPIVDRINPKKILLWTSIVQVVVQALVIFFIINEQRVIILPFIFVSALLSNITYPIEEVMIPKIVEGNKIVLANGLFSFSYKTLDIVINSLSAFLLLWLSFKNMYLLTIFFFLLAIIFILQFKYKSDNEVKKYQVTEYFSDIKFGANYFFSHHLILKLSIPLVLLNLFNAVNAVAMPFFVRNFSHSLEFLGIFGLATGFGGLLGNLLVHKLSQMVSVGKLIIVLLMLDGIMRFIGLVSNNMTFILFFFFLASMFAGIYNTVFASLYQMIPKMDYIGRVGTFVDSFIAIAMPIGGILGGLLIKGVGSKNTLLFFSIVAILASVYYMFDRNIVTLPVVNKIERDC